MEMFATRSNELKFSGSMLDTKTYFFSGKLINVGTLQFRFENATWLSRLLDYKGNRCLEMGG